MWEKLKGRCGECEEVWESAWGECGGVGKCVGGIGRVMLLLILFQLE